MKFEKSPNEYRNAKFRKREKWLVVSLIDCVRNEVQKHFSFLFRWCIQTELMKTHVRILKLRCLAFCSTILHIESMGIHLLHATDKMFPRIICYSGMYFVWKDIGRLMR